MERLLQFSSRRDEVEFESDFDPLRAGYSATAQSRVAKNDAVNNCGCSRILEAKHPMRVPQVSSFCCASTSSARGGGDSGGVRCSPLSCFLASRWRQYSWKCEFDLGFYYILVSPPPAPGEINLPTLQQPKSQYVESVSLSVSQPAGGMSTYLPVMCFRCTARRYSFL